jgi:hypothetical protein
VQSLWKISNKSHPKNFYRALIYIFEKNIFWTQ